MKDWTNGAKCTQGQPFSTMGSYNKDGTQDPTIKCHSCEKYGGGVSCAEYQQFVEGRSKR